MLVLEGQSGDRERAHHRSRSFIPKRLETGDEVSKEREQKSESQKRHLLALQVLHTTRGHLRQEWHTHRQTADESADMGAVVDANDVEEDRRQTDSQIQTCKLNHALPQSPQLSRGDAGTSTAALREPLIRQKHNQDARDAKDRS